MVLGNEIEKDTFEEQILRALREAEGGIRVCEENSKLKAVRRPFARKIRLTTR